MIILTYNFQVEYFLFVHAIDYGFTRIFSLIVHLKASKHQISTPTVGTFLHMDSAKKSCTNNGGVLLLFWSTSMLISMTAHYTITIRLKIVIENVSLDIYYFRSNLLVCVWVEKNKANFRNKFLKTWWKWYKGFYAYFQFKIQFLE